MHHGSSWGTVCNADFDQRVAEVVCRELDCGVPAELRGAAAFGQSEGQVWAQEIQCRGNESQIDFCPTGPSQNQSCSHGNDVGLVCSGYTDSRLVGGSNNCSGRVELQYLGTWGTVCDGCWDRKTSNVLCQQLNCGTAVAVPGQAWFGEGNGSIWADVFDCHGNETRLSQCAVSSWSRVTCSHGQDAGVICSGSGLYEDPPSGYDDVGDGEGHSLSGDLVMEDTPENYDDVITADQHPDRELLEGDAPEFFDDVISMQQGPEAFSGENILAPESPPAPSGMDYANVGEEPLERGGAY
ncbi:hypothetical protein SKAU_G00275030 [Synaphobranchus kaupii]|uniref:SRCR domain-containing protein n=1 Tax=Synaphobranchus kaupii TaxID=118154 RepID=A0A9Q1IQZ2_SYNKA|nr:hypothetical protein SKAU_G00275030 [Synaphobranchus kaupii]